jgi:hypothetical protein
MIYNSLYHDYLQQIYLWALWPKKYGRFARVKARMKRQVSLCGVCFAVRDHQAPAWLFLERLAQLGTRRASAARPLYAKPHASSWINLAASYE